jgi:hypothetical protein
LKRPALVAAALVLALGGCTGRHSPDVATAGQSTPAAGPSTTASADGTVERERKLIACMRAHGIDIPDPQPGDEPGSAIRHQLDDLGKGTDPAFQAALDQCQPPPSAGAKPTADPETIAKRRGFAKCMREHGLPDFPDPDPITGELYYVTEPGQHEVRQIQRVEDGVYLGAGPAIDAALKQCR